MKKYFLVLVIALVLGVVAVLYNTGTYTDNQESAEPEGRVLRYGIFSKVRGGELVDSEQTSTGKALSKLVMTFIRETDQVPVERGRLLGYQYRLSSLPETHTVKLRRVLRHPPFTLPDGTISTGSDYTINKKVERNEVFAYDVYSLDEDYEMVAGDWLFQIWYKDRLLVEQSFTTQLKQLAME